jgi:putative FmdB family regulatory protein
LSKGLNLGRIIAVPTYVYACNTCGAQFEQFQRFSDEPLTVCPRCQAALRRVFQPVGIVFKGSGWYVTDSRAKNSTATSGTSDNGKATDSAPKSDTADTADTATPKAPGDAAKGDPAPKPASDAKPAGDAKPASDAKPTAPAA